MQPNPKWNALLALTTRLVADNQPITLLELSDMVDVSHDVARGRRRTTEGSLGLGWGLPA